MNNIVRMPNMGNVTPVSPIMFTAYERPLYYTGKEGTQFSNTGHKALVRVDTEGKPVCLNVVSETYKLIQNAELFGMIEDELLEALTPSQAHGAVVKDRVAYGGRDCIREYIFPNVCVESPDRDTINFRVISMNGFGGSAVKFLTGAIDNWCTNGMINGDFISDYAKHTSGLRIGRFAGLVKRAVEVFWTQRDMWSAMRMKKVVDDETILKWLEHNFGERLGGKMFRQYLIEQQSRGGRNLWSLYSALTYYASHNEGEFALRETKNDHAAVTMLKREGEVQRILAGGKLLELEAA